MASLISCKACGAKISSRAAACPQCGHPVPKRTSVVTWIVTGFFGLIVVASLPRCGSDAPTASQPASAASTPKPPRPEPSAAEKKRSEDFSKAVFAAATLQGASKDPASFELSSVDVHSDGPVCYVFRAKNSFNAMLQGRALLQKNGKILVQEHDGNRFVRSWNESCTKGDFEERSGDVMAVLRMRR